MSKRMAVVVATVLFLSLAGCNLLTLEDLVGVVLPPNSAAMSNLVLMNQAEASVQRVYPNALLIEAAGIPSGGAATTADDIDRWVFVFVEDPNAATSGTVILTYANGVFSEPQYDSSGWTGTVYERLPRELSLADAVARLRDAGYDGLFTSVTLRKPLTFPQPEEALYAFSVGGQFVLVGAETGNVANEATE